MKTSPLLCLTALFAAACAKEQNAADPMRNDPATASVADARVEFVLDQPA